jgi:hypothetical protein
MKVVLRRIDDIPKTDEELTMPCKTMQKKGTFPQKKHPLQENILERYEAGFDG